MSGGSYDYFFGRIEEFAGSIRANHVVRGKPDPRRLAFARLLDLVAKAAHDIEWVDSCDFSEGDDHAAIDAALSFGGGDAGAIVMDEARRQIAAICDAVGLKVTP